jgi:hypothetical protein
MPATAEAEGNGVVAIDPKILERITKQLKLAAKSSGTTIEERTVAALQAADLIDQYQLMVVVTPPKPPKKRRRPEPAVSAVIRPETWTKCSYWVPPRHEHWQATFMTELTPRALRSCISCRKMIENGAEVWADPAFGYRHYDIQCADVT